MSCNGRRHAQVAVVLAITLFSSSVAAEPSWRARLAWWNDLFAEIPPADDSGFTNDFEVEAWRGEVGGRIFYRIITEQFGTLLSEPTPTRRWDQLDMIALLRRARELRGFTFSLTARGGVAIGGNLGGLAIQDSWHRLTKTGASTDEGLQDNYDGDHRAGAVAGARGEATREFGPLALRVGIDGQLALGETGIRFLTGFGGGAVTIGTRTTFSASADLLISRFATVDPNLTLRGGYGVEGGQVGAVLSVSVGRAVARSWAIGWTLRLNESGSGEPVGLLWFEISP